LLELKVAGCGVDVGTAARARGSSSMLWLAASTALCVQTRPTACRYHQALALAERLGHTDAQRAISLELKVAGYGVNGEGSSGHGQDQQQGGRQRPLGAGSQGQSGGSRLNARAGPAMGRSHIRANATEPLQKTPLTAGARAPDKASAAGTAA
jgi:hypothetical protein